MKQLLLLTATLILTVAHGQNLVPNPSFENYTSCPTNFSELSLATPWVVPANTGSASPDLYNACDSGFIGVPNNTPGYLNANTGVGYAGIYTFLTPNIREYLQTQLTSPLIAGNIYQIEMYVSPSDNAGIAIDAIGIYISTNAIAGTGNYNVLPYTPQISNPSNNIISDTTGWTLVSGTYTALGGENYITIGNFLDDSNTNTLVFNSPGWSSAYYLIDDVSLTIATGIENLQNTKNISIYPNPFSSQTTLQTDNFLHNATLTVINSFGQTVKEIQNISGQTVTLLRENLPNGLYFVRLTEGNKTVLVAKLVVAD